MLEVGTPDDLAAMSAGPGLSAALHAVPLEAVPNDRMLEVLRAQYRQLSHEQARMAAVLVEIGRCDGVPTPGAVSRSADADPHAVHETRAALRWTRAAAESEHALAEYVLGELPAVFAAWVSGDLDRARVRVFERYLYGLGSEQAAAVCAHAVPRAPSLTTGQLAALLRRLVIAVDPDAAARWYRQRMRERDVCAYMAVDGTVTVSAHGLPADEAEAACRRVERLAAAAKRAGHPGTVGQIRADVFLGLLDGRFHGMEIDELVAALVADRHRPTADISPTGSSSGEVGEAEDGAGPGPGRPRSDGRGGNGTDDDGPEERGADDGGPDDGGPDDGGPDGGGPGRPGPGGPGGPGPDGGGPGGPGRGGGPGHDGPERDESPGSDHEAGAIGRRRPGGAHRTGADDQRRGIEIRVSLSTLLGHDDHPGGIPGLGPVPAPVARARVALQTRSEWRFAVVDADGTLVTEGRTRDRPVGSTRTGSPPGGIVELHVSEDLLRRLADNPTCAGAWAPVVADIADHYRDRDQHLVDLDAPARDRLPATALRRHTEIRDQTCSFAGVCRRPAHAGHQDHRRDHARGGSTTAANLGPTCAQDHVVKHQAGWIVDPAPSGGVRWQSPLGGVYTSRGEFLCDRLPAPVPRPDPRPDTPPARTVEGPIVRRPPPSDPTDDQPMRTAPDTDAHDEPPF